MKLVDILARELKVWPEGVTNLKQSFGGMIFYLDASSQLVILDRADIAQDWREAKVTFAQWQAAVDALKDEQMTYSYENVSINAPYISLGEQSVIPECKIIQSAWTGEGLPPVGTVCEYLEDGNGDWEQVRIVAIDQHLGYSFAVYSSDNGYSGNRRAELFRPIRTPEQIAAEERAIAVEQMVADIRSLIVGPDDFSKCGILYDAGYRKLEITEE